MSILLNHRFQPRVREIPFYNRQVMQRLITEGTDESKWLLHWMFIPTSTLLSLREHYQRGAEGGQRWARWGERTARKCHLLDMTWSLYSLTLVSVTYTRSSQQDQSILQQAALIGISGFFFLKKRRGCERGGVCVRGYPGREGEGQRGWAWSLLKLSKNN